MKHFQPPEALSDAPIGLGLRLPHLDEVSWKRPAVDFFEVHPENYILDKASFEKLAHLRSDYPLSLHAVSLSLGSRDGLNGSYVAALRDLVDRLEPFLVSDHLAWSTLDGVFLNDLLPLPYTKETLDLFADNVDRVQNALRRTILVENPSAYIQFHGIEFQEPEFLRMLAARTGCGLLLDVNNVFVSAANLSFDARSYLRAFPFEAVREIHLAGHQRKDIQGETVLIDDHGSCVSRPVWALYADAIARARNAATLIEWDSNIPAFDVLLEQRDRAQALARAAPSPERAPKLATVQAEMAKALLTTREPELAFTGHLSVYRNNVRESVSQALRSVYAGTEVLVGSDFFRQTALQFIGINPPRVPSLAAYGREFPEFLNGLPSCRGIPYLADVARLEWHASRASLHHLAAPLAPERLKNSMCNDPARLCFVPQLGLSHLASVFPVDDIWSFARARGDGTPPPIDGHAVFLEISPGENGVLIRRLEEADFTFRQTLSAGADLGMAADAAMQVDPAFVLFAALRSALGDGIFTDCLIEQSQFEEVRSCPC